MFTQRHYEWLARFAARLDARDQVALADALALDNSKFKREKFLYACCRATGQRLAEELRK